MSDYLATNLANWNSRVPHHEIGYDLDRYRTDPSSLSGVVRFDRPRLGDIAGLRVGQVLKLPATPQTRVKVESSDQPLFWAYLGQSEGVHTLCIDEAIDHEREFINDVLAR